MALTVQAAANNATVQTNEFHGWPAAQKCVDALREKLRPIVQEHSKKNTHSPSQAERQLAEAQTSANLAEAKVAEVVARVRSAEVRGDAKALVAVQRELMQVRNAE